MDTRCPATGTPIRAHLSPQGDGTAWAEPATAVVSVKNPIGAEFAQLDQRSAAERDQKICTHQVMFAAPEAAALAGRHPGGRLIPGDQFFAWMHRVGLH